MVDTYAPSYVVFIGGQRLPDELAQRVLGVEIEEEDGKLPKVTVTFHNGDLAITDHGLLATGKAFKVRWGYLGDVTWAELSGTVKAVKGFKQRQVIAYGEAHAMASQSQTKVWQKVRYSDIATQIARKWNLRPVVRPTQALHEQVAQSNETDYRFLQRLAGEVGYQFYVADGELHFHPKEFGDKPVLALTYYGTDGNLIDFEPVEKELAEPGEVTVAGLDPATKQPFEVKASNATTQREAAGPVAVFSGETGRQLAVTSPADPKTQQRVPTAAPTAAQAKEKADAAFRKAEESVIQARITAVGDVRLRAGRVVTVHGVGRRYSGNWRVKKAIHRLGQGYVVEAELERNAAAGAPQGASDKPPTQAQVNPAKAEPQDNRRRVVVYSGETGQEVGRT